MAEGRDVHVHLTSQLAPPDQLAGGVAVVIDVLRATTTILHALASGCSAVRPCAEVEEARELADSLRAGRVLLGGERGGKPLPAFDIGNSPREYTAARCRGAVLVLTTSNGSRALLHAAAAERVLVAAFVNYSAVCEQLRRETRPIHIVCAGDDGAVALEDALLAGALLVASGCPPRYSPSHTSLYGVWAQASEARVPIVFHVGGTGDLIDHNYFVNGRPIPPDFHGGEENFRSVDYMGIPVPPAQTLATLIFDGVLERFPGLRVGVIEQGAIWVPSWLRQMESAFEAFARHEERLQALSMRPTDYVHRQVRFTPYPTEDVGWIVAQAGADLVMFSSDYPHVEGGRKPLERFEASLGDAGAGEDVRRAFYTDNFMYLMGRAAAELAA